MRKSIIGTHATHALLALALLATPAVAHAAATAAPMPAGQATKVQEAAAEEQRVIDDIVRAQADLAHGRRLAAVNQVENAETVLLNAQQDATYRATRTLTALEGADVALKQRHADLKSASQALQNAEAALHDPGVAAARGSTPSRGA